MHSAQDRFSGGVELTVSGGRPADDAVNIPKITFCGEKAFEEKWSRLMGIWNADMAICRVVTVGLTEEVRFEQRLG